MSRKGAGWIALIGLVAMGAAACSSASGTSASGGFSASSGKSKQIIMFMPPTSDPYAATYLAAAQKQAAADGYTLKAIQSSATTGAASQESQVQQVLGSGQLPAAFIWWPSSADAEVATLASLSRSKVPVFESNQYPAPNSDQYLTAYVGVSDLLSGNTPAKLAIQARDALKSHQKLHGADGTALVVALPAGYKTTADRLTGFKQGLAGSGLKIQAVGYSNGLDSAAGFTMMNQLITANKAKGFDVVYAEEDDLASGAIQALQQAGYKPGHNVEVIGGSCHGNETNLVNATEFGTAVQGAGMEGQFSMQMIEQYLKNPHVNPGTYNAPVVANAFPPLPATISKYDIVPNPYVTSATQYKSYKLWGTPAVNWCTF
jgi:ABC-type sugar transport system substrate-binding protein